MPTPRHHLVLTKRDASILKGGGASHGVATEVTIVEEHAPGEQAEVDFGEFKARIGSDTVRLWLFIMRLSASGRSFVVAFANQAQEAFFEGHVLAFAHFGGVPTGHIRYDNLKPAVIRIFTGRDRQENERFVTLRSHYPNRPKALREVRRDSLTVVKCCWRPRGRRG